MGSRGSHIALANAYHGVTEAVADLDDADLQRITRCHGWLVADLLFHLVCDAQRALVALASPADAPATVDAVSSVWHPADRPIGTTTSTSSRPPGLTHSATWNAGNSAT
ncbi:maleylpyruvate isomerase N-terminal domain-containing protein [Micromonospora sp. FIMYZ51]|uniref:maleylpyruvate isomerase N-terminal domain-containing protein n=1 Tax=Micromonospora sp. FIMYZ51 TaxID=3051832 RepID=UPI00311FEDF9